MKHSVPPTDAARQLAQEVTRDWPPKRTAMAFRAAGVGFDEGETASLEAIAAEAGVSRETVRRARNDLLAAMDSARVATPGTAARPGATLRGPAPHPVPSTARALRRVLTMTGPMPWDEVLSAWARAQGKPPYLPLPADMAVVSQWARSTEGLIVTPSTTGDGTVNIGVDSPEDLDGVSAFLFGALMGQTNGVQRSALLEAAETSGLKPTTIATSLSYHPAVVRIGPGAWALRGQRSRASQPVGPQSIRKRGPRPRPTGFRWADSGALILEFSIPRGPSPVVAVPRAIADLVEGRTFNIESEGRRSRVAVGRGRLWGFGSLATDLGLSAGDRAKLTLDLLAGLATLSPAPEGRGSDVNLHA